MASSCGLLDEDVRIVANTGQKTPGGMSMSYFVSYRSMEAEEIARCKNTKPKGLVDWIVEGKVSLVVDISPPLKPLAMYTLSLHLPATPREIVSQLKCVRVVSVVKNLIVLSTGSWLAKVPASGEYMVYNTDTDTLLLAPTVDWGKFRQIYMSSRVVMHRTGSSSFEGSCCYGPAIPASPLY